MIRHDNVRSVLTGNVVVVTAVILFSIYVIYLGVQLPTRPDQVDPGPGLFPILVAVMLIFFAAIELFREFRANADGPKEPLIDRENLDKIAPPLVLLGIYILLMPFMGFLISSIALLLILYWYSGVNYKRSIPLSIGISIIVFYIFRRIFRIPLPENIILPISRLLPSLPSIF